MQGGIASGKSSISKRLQELGAEIIDCDKLAHQLYAPGKSCYNLIVNEFGKKILLENGEINRKVLGSIVFSDKVIIIMKSIYCLFGLIFFFFRTSCKN